MMRVIERESGMISKSLRMACIVMVMLCLAWEVMAGVIKVPGDWSKIQWAIDAAADGDEIIVWPGTYYENIYFKGKNITLRSTDPTSAAIVAATAIDANNAGAVVAFSGTELASCNLSGFTISHGRSLGGGGIRGNGTLATIEHNAITTNAAVGLMPTDACGGGISQCYGAVRNNTISGNSAERNGGGLHQCHGIIENNIIFANTAYYAGGLYGCNGVIKDNIISLNSAAYGGGISNCDGVVRDNCILSNAAEYGGGLAGCGGSIWNNTILENSAQFQGGGIYDCDINIKGNDISKNKASYGGGLAACDGTVERNTIFGNSATFNGGGIYWCDETIQNNLVAGNSAGVQGGGLYECDGTIQNNTIYDNSALDTGGGLHNCRWAIKNCIIWNNIAASGNQLYWCVTPSYSCIQDWTSIGIGIISDDPQFLDADGGDFHLRAGSPCIDAGCFIEGLSADFEGDPRPWNGTVELRGDGSDYDIGSDEYVRTYPGCHGWVLY